MAEGFRAYARGRCCVIGSA